MMGLKKFYEEISLVYGLAVVIMLTMFLTFDGLQHCIILLEPNPYIRIPEIILGIIVLPYYFKKIYGGKKWKQNTIFG